MNPGISTPIASFAAPLPPPAPLIVPINLTDLHTPSFLVLLDREDLELSQPPILDDTESDHVSPLSRFHPYQKARGQSNTQKKVLDTSSKGKERAISFSPTPTPRLESPVPPTSISQHGAPLEPSTSGTRPVAIVTVPIKIIRPKNASRQNLEALLQDWSADEYKAFRAAVTLKCRNVLDPKKSWVGQDAKKLSKVKNEILEEYPRLNRYDDAWPIDIALQASLKSTSAAAKK